MNLSNSTAMLITLQVGLSYALAVAYCVVNYDSSEKIAKLLPVVTTHRLASSPLGLRDVQLLHAHRAATQERSHLLLRLLCTRP
jgi:hypothetical protein